MPKPAHAIVHGKTTRVVHRDRVGQTVTMQCTCGATVRSKGGSDGAFSAFNKHVKRAAQQ